MGTLEPTDRPTTSWPTSRPTMKPTNKPTMKPTEKPIDNSWPTAKPVACCKDELTERDCLANVNNGKPCTWLAADAPLAVKFNTRCLGETIVNGKGGYGSGKSGESNGGVADVCHPEVYDYSQGLRRRYAVQNGSVDTVSGYSPNVEIAVLLSAATVLAICGYSACYQQRKEEQYELL